MGSYGFIVYAGVLIAVFAFILIVIFRHARSMDQWGLPPHTRGECFPGTDVPNHDLRGIDVCDAWEGPLPRIFVPESTVCPVQIRGATEDLGKFHKKLQDRLHQTLEQLAPGYQLVQGSVVYKGPIEFEGFWGGYVEARFRKIDPPRARRPSDDPVITDESPVSV